MVARIALTALLTMTASAASAQVDPTGRWRTLQTAHFNVHVRGEYRDLGPRVAREAEAAWSAMAGRLPAPRHRIELVVADNVDDANGFASTYPLPRIVVYAMPPAGDLQLSTYDRWLRMVIVHELAHVFHIDHARGIWSLGRSLLGRAPFLFPNDYTPPWMREGLAVFYESRVTGAGRLSGAYLRAITGANLAEAGPLPVDAANTLTPKWPAGLRAYAFGSQFMEHGARQAGDTAIAAFVRTVAVQPLPWVQLGSAWWKATGQSLGAAWEAAQVGEGAEGQRGEGRRDAGDSATILVRGLRGAIPPRLSPDGRWLALVHNDGRDATRLVLLDRASPDSAPVLRRVTRLVGVSGIAWLPDRRILASQLEWLDPYTLRSDLWIIGLDGSERRVTRGERLREADAARDGAIVAVRVVPGGTELVLHDPGPGHWSGGPIDPSGWRTIAASRPGVDWASPRFRPGGDLIAAVRVEDGRHDIVLLDRAGRGRRAVTRDRVPDLQPAFSADGRWLTWSRELEGVPQVVALPLTGDTTSHGFRLTAEPWAAWGAAPGAGDTLYYLAYHADGYALARTVTRPHGGWSSEPDSSVPMPDSPFPIPHSRERAYSAFPSILPRYWMPQVFVATGGSWLGVLTSGADALERHLWSASLLAGLGTLRGQYSGSLAYAYTGMRHVTLDAAWSHRPEVFLAAPAGTPTFVCCDPDDQLHAGITFIRRRARTSGQLRFGVEHTADRQAARRGFSIAASAAHTIDAPLGISTQDGWRAGLSLRHRERVGSGLTSTQLVLRGSGYVSSGSRSFARQVFAVRGAVGSIAGGDPSEFSVGGVSSGSIAIVPGVVLGSGARNFPVRGYASGAQIGRRVVNLSLENRVPLALIARGLGMMPVGLDRLSAALFTDAALTWSRSNCPDFGTPVTELCRDWMWSVGAELSADLALGYHLPLRARAGAALRVKEDGKAGAWIAIGQAF